MASFEGEPARWFAVEDPVKLVAAVLRERIREACRALPVAKLLAELPKLVRSAPREGVLADLADNGMVVDRIELNSAQLAEGKLAAAFAAAQHEAVELQLKDDQAARRLASQQVRDGIDQQEHALTRLAHQRMSETSKAELSDQHQIELHKLELAAEREQAELERRNQREREAVE
ncbi:MAG: hypothetical protein HC927_09720, partial [Deltaproteobacteria bacterium]|nr:hypothetical protein [Deltaproteobacteria bacterium]